MIFYAFATFCALLMHASYRNFQHQVKTHQAAQIVMPEDSVLKAKGINLPGYNR